MTAWLAASILTADFGDLKKELLEAQKYNLDLVHFDVMDGNFVPNITFGASLIASLKKSIKLPFDVHLMIQNPEFYLDSFLAAGADMLSFHWEAMAKHKQKQKQETVRLLTKIRQQKVSAGIAISPETDPEAIKPLLEYLDFVVIMTVQPGFGGQKLIEDCLPKIEFLREIIHKKNLAIKIEVDGGIKKSNASRIAKLGADILVVGSAIFHPDYTVQEGLESLQKELKKN